MPPPILWEREVCQALKIHTEQELDAYLEKTRGALQEIMDLAVRFGWVQEAIYGNFVASYPPGSYRPWSLDLTVYDGDSLLGEKAFLKQASSPAPRGVRFERFERNSGLFLFVKARLRAFLDGSRVNADPAPSASSVVVMAKLPDGIWWPARLVPRVEYEDRIKYHGSKEEKAAARRLRSHGGEPEETMVVLLCHVAITGVHDYYMAKECYRITYEELEELFYFSLAGKRAGIPDSFGPDARFLIRKPLKSAQRTNEFRSAVAFALAIDRLVPEQRRRVLITAPCTNGDAVPGFESAQLENPVTPELEKDRSFALPLESLRAGLAKIGLDPDGGGGGGGGVGGGPAASSSAAASSSLSAAHLEVPQVKLRLVPGPPMRQVTMQQRPIQQLQPIGAGPMQQRPSRKQQPGGGSGVPFRLQLPPAMEEEEEEEEEDLIGGGGGAAEGNTNKKRPAPDSAAGAGVASSSSGAAASAPAAAASAAASNTHKRQATSHNGAAAASSPAAAAATTGAGGGGGAAAVGGGGGGGGGWGGQSDPAAELLAAFERAIEAAGMQEDAEAKAMLDRLRRAAAAFAEGGLASFAEAQHAFVELWKALRPQLEQQRVALRDAAVAAIRAYLTHIGLEGHATAIIDSKSIQALHNRLDALLALDGWTRTTLQAAGEALEQEKAQTTQTLALLSESLRIASLDLAPEIGIVKTKAAERVKELNGLLERHDEAMHLRNATVDAQIPQLLESLRQVEALAPEHENKILALWGAFVERAASSSR